ncbi:hypothetical protein IGI04_018339 [Brassica rapa subsp. trilocularis]|uniref:Uncharacterized protein n=1 Tax=Brassica rapa subsp. trilocularis TaxID=1813537 RepID=A0ABQ7MCN1_BRACM|nr:hypothetical protein IGI04_018339 [Brassica rapa subsp. trilocularis]
MGRTEAFIRFRDDVTKVEKEVIAPSRLVDWSRFRFLAKPIPRESASEPRLTRSAGLGPLFDGLCGWVKSIPNSKSPPSSLMVEQSIFDEFDIFSSENKRFNPSNIHHGAMMDTENMDLAQRLLVSEAREQFRGDDDGQEAVDASIVPVSYYPGNIFAEESPLEVWRIRPSVVDGQDWSNVERTKSTVDVCSSNVCFSSLFFLVGHPNLATYPEDWRESARIVALQKQDHWEDFTRERIQRSVDRIANQSWISEPHPHINQSTSKRLSLFTRAEQKEINRAKTMKQLPDLSLIVAGKIGAKRGASENRVGPSGLEVVEATPIATEQARTGGSSQGKSSKKSKKSAGGPKDSSEPEHPGADGSSKKGGKKRKAGDPPSEDIPKKKRMKKKEPAPPRSSSVCEEELQALVPEAIPEVGTSEDDENETIALRRRRRESRVTEEVFRGALAGDLRSTEVPRGISTSGGQRDRLRNESPAHVTEGSETRVSGRPKETPADGFRFEFNRELPLACYPEDCARLLRLVKGGPDQLPSVGDLIFKDEYEHASCSSVKSHGDWNVLVEKYDSSLRRAREQIRESEEAKKRMEEALRVSTREKADAIAREKALRKAFDETRTSDAAELQMCKESMNNLEFVVDKQRKEKADLEAKMAAELLRHSEEMDRLRKSHIDPAKQASAGAVVLKDGAVPTIVLTDSPAKASKNASSSASSSEDPEKGDDALAGMPTADATAPAPTKFGRVSGPGEGDGRGNEDPPVVD